MEIKINGLKWEVAWVKENSKKLICDDVKCLGVTYFDKNRIYLNKTLSEKEFEVTVIHELAHAFLFSNDVQLNTDDDRVDETVCEFIEKNLKKIMKLSTKIVKAWKIERMMKTFS